MRSLLLAPALALFTAACALHTPSRPPEVPITPPHPSDADIAAALGPTLRYHVPVDDRPCRGGTDPLVTIVEFIDFHSRFVRKVEPTVEQLLHDYGADLRVCVRHSPIARDNPSAVDAAEAAEEALAQGGSPAFFLAYAHLLAGPVTPESVAATASAAHLDQARFEAALADHRHRGRWIADMKMADDTGHTGAPSFFIQGVHLGGARPLPDFQRVIGDELGHARGLIAIGVPRAQLFDVVLAHAQGKRVEEPARPGEPPVVWIREIQVAYGGYGVSPQSRTREDALKLAQALLARIRAGEDFAAVAREKSEGGTAAGGGEHGALTRGHLTVPIEDAAFALPVGGISNVVEGEHGFTIIQRFR